MNKESQISEKNEHPLKGNRAKIAGLSIISPAQKYHYELKQGSHGPYIQKRLLWSLAR